MRPPSSTLHSTTALGCPDGFLEEVPGRQKEEGKGLASPTEHIIDKESRQKQERTLMPQMWSSKYMSLVKLGPEGWMDMLKQGFFH